ncbi:MAG: hypothetical protein H6842_05900 [Rhodospirillaceae bacterium]|nr:hypothetical protein [Rhodospirillaceae bacterium]
MRLEDRLRAVPAPTGPGGDIDETGDTVHLGWKDGDDVQVLTLPSDGVSDLLQVVLHLAAGVGAKHQIHPRDVVAAKKVSRAHQATGIAHLGRAEDKEILGIVIGNAYTQVALTADQARRLAEAILKSVNQPG